MLFVCLFACSFSFLVGGFETGREGGEVCISWLTRPKDHLARRWSIPSRSAPGAVNFEFRKPISRCAGKSFR